MQPQLGFKLDHECERNNWHDNYFFELVFFWGRMIIQNASVLNENCKNLKHNFISSQNSFEVF